jgi:hypothetical protein
MRAIALGFQLALSVVRSNWQGFFNAGIICLSGQARQAEKEFCERFIH